MALEKNVIIVSITVGVLGLLSVLLGFSAEGTKTTFSDLYVTWDGGCVHRTGPAFGMALAAALLLLVGQIIMGTFSGCGGCCQKGKQLAGTNSVMGAQVGTKRTTALIMFSLSWVTFAVSFIMFILGGEIETRGADGHVDSKCTIVKPGIFACASILALSTSGLGIGAYILLNNSNGTKPGEQGGVAMGHPQFPPSNGQQQFVQSNGQQQFQQNMYQQQTQPGVVPAQVPQKPVNNGQQYPPPGTTPPGYGYNTQSYA